MKTGASYLRVIIFLLLAFLMLEYVTENGAMATLEQYPIIWALLAMILFIAIAIEIIIQAFKTILYRGLNEEARERYLAAEAVRKEQQFGWLKRTYKKLLGSKPMEQEEEIILDHNYDGIKELDNSLPPWWVYLFYATILFGAIYLVRFEVFKDYDQIEEYEAEVAEARIEIEAYKKTAKNLVDVNTVVLLTDPGDLNAGKTIFTDNCVACHKADGGGGIGPNLTDEYWILGGGIKNVFNTISEGGRDGKGMISWKNDLKPLEMAQVASYLLQFQGTTPAEPKAPEGEIWTDPNLPSGTDSESIPAAVVDTTSVVETEIEN
ncbi:MAG: cbb3-type cytochrome c oxidase N-terminal domain-containing protein [Bacteroidota bacterium]